MPMHIVRAAYALLLTQIMLRTNNSARLEQTQDTTRDLEFGISRKSLTRRVAATSASKETRRCS